MRSLVIVLMVSLSAGGCDGVSSQEDTSGGVVDAVIDTSVDAATDASDPGVDAPAIADVAPDAPDAADSAGTQPVVTNAWVAGTTFAVTMDVGTTEWTYRPWGEPAAWVLQRLDDGVLVSLVADGEGGLSAWVTFAEAGGAVQATGPVVQGAALDLTFSANHPPPACESVGIDDAHLLLDGVDTGGDGTVDLVRGTWSGEASVTEGDTSTSANFDSEVSGLLDHTPPLVDASAFGQWPEGGFVIRTQEPVLAAALSAAIDHRVDTEPVSFTLTPAGLEGPPGAALAWRLVSDVPYPPGVVVTVAVGPVPDLQGNESVSTAEKTLVLAALPPAKLGTEWDFSGGSCFVPGTWLEIAPTFGDVAAPTGGAMAVLDLDLESGRVADAALELPATRTAVRLTLAIAISGDITFAEATPPIQILAADAKAQAWIPTPQTSTDVLVGETTWHVSPFETVDVDLTGIATSQALLRFAFSHESLYCGPFYYPKGALRVLIDHVSIL